MHTLVQYGMHGPIRAYALAIRHINADASTRTSRCQSFGARESGCRCSRRSAVSRTALCTRSWKISKRFRKPWQRPSTGLPMFNMYTPLPVFFCQSSLAVLPRRQHSPFLRARNMHAVAHTRYARVVADSRRLAITCVNVLYYL